MTETQVSSCIFCKIVSGQIPGKRVFEDSSFIVIPDIQPKAKCHFLVIPKTHTASLETAYPETGSNQSELIGQMFAVATQVARLEGLLPHGFRSIVNTGAGAGQTVFHLHLHVLGGETLGEDF